MYGCIASSIGTIFTGTHTEYVHIQIISPTTTPSTININLSIHAHT